MNEPVANLPRKRIQAHRPWWELNLADVYSHRELLWLLMWRNLRSRYAQMSLGMLWSVLEPLTMLLTLVFVFGFLMRVPTDGVPYPVFVFAAQIPWLLFSKATLNAISCLQEHMGLISKVSFPRLLLPFATVFRDVFDAVILLAILIVLAAFYGYLPTWRLAVMPFLLLGVALLAISFGLWLAGALVRYRDLRPIMVIVLQIGFYVSPVLFPITLVPPSLLPVYSMNPMFWAILISRWAILNQPLVITPSFYVAVVVLVVMFISGLFVFADQERAAVDVQ